MVWCTPLCVCAENRIVWLFVFPACFSLNRHVISCCHMVALQRYTKGVCSCVSQQSCAFQLCRFLAEIHRQFRDPDLWFSEPFGFCRHGSDSLTLCFPTASRWGERIQRGAQSHFPGRQRLCAVCNLLVRSPPPPPPIHKTLRSALSVRK